MHEMANYDMGQHRGSRRTQADELISRRRTPPPATWWLRPKPGRPTTPSPIRARARSTRRPEW